jgi:outer membrane protein TolC
VIVMTRRVVYLFSVSFLWCAAVAWAEKPLGLWGCVEKAVRGHPVAEAGRWSVEGARRQLDRDNTLLLPELTTEAHYSARTYIPEIPLPGGAIDLGDHHDAGVGVGVSYLLYDWDRRKLLLEADRRDVEAEARILDNRREFLAYEAGSAYLLLQAARRNVEISRSAISTAEAHLKDVQSMLDHGLATPDVVLKARVRVEQAKVEADRRENALEVARANLLQRMGLPLTSETEFGEAVEEIPTDPDHMLTSIFSSRPHLQVYDSRLAGLESRAAMQSAGDKPSVRLFAGADYARPGIDQFRNDWIAYGRAGVALRWEFYDWGRSGYEARKTEALRMELTHERNVKRADVALAVKTARMDAGHARRRVELADNALDAAREHFRVVGNLFDNGQITSSDFLDAQEEVTVSSLEHSRAGYELDLARWRLALATGELEKEIDRRWPEAARPVSMINVKAEGGNDAR